VPHKHHTLLALAFTLMASIPGALGADTGNVIALVGAFCGAPIMWLFPSLIFLQVSCDATASDELAHSLVASRFFAEVTLTVGAALFVLCVICTVLAL
jgi:hypothetical protein